MRISSITLDLQHDVLLYFFSMKTGTLYKWRFQYIASVLEGNSQKLVMSFEKKHNELFENVHEGIWRNSFLLLGLLLVDYLFIL